MPISSSLIWLVAGAVLCSIELFLPTAFVAFMMGISALSVALISLVIPNLWLQAIAWLLLSTALIVISRRFVSPPRRKSRIHHAIVAETITEIPPGKPGRVLYEGNSWRALCDDDTVVIPPYAKVYVIRRQGTTLIVMPEDVVISH
jgi:membrane protein implicated in regulation of membrane protease activity